MGRLGVCRAVCRKGRSWKDHVVAREIETADVEKDAERHSVRQKLSMDDMVIELVEDGVMM